MDIYEGPARTADRADRAADHASDATRATRRTVTLRDGGAMPLFGMGTWHMAEDPSRHDAEVAALREGLALGARLIDTAELYADGGAETLVGEALRGAEPSIRREDLFVVSKVMPSHAGRTHMRESCEASLERLGTDYLDLYLLHWPGSVPLRETVACMEALRSDGLIRRWGVSNFDVADMEALWRVPGGDACAVNQVLYHIESRGTEVALRPWMDAHGVAMMAYCPIAQGGRLAYGVLDDPTVRGVARRHGVTPAQVLLAWAMRDGRTVAIPKAGTVEHMRLNVAASRLELDTRDLAELDARFPAPRVKPPLDWL
ncbi:aldo/keto reductase [Bifidobacterium sp. DSM 109958]|uniref:Aldo/keto reductase n=1 Tax=Bifidobacterium moraviense TaxID=2675323 RepID=A0A7Y0HZR5_9BIFI|nr:aldo/keto reductase [Bifidobacterium sp. DSM 109958]NMN00668.1 aldo/keto reductase [Bifidobacterium sp. DSM 109958]